ncbi:hypothetical protein MMC19_000177 [Ptychographa xylographoides]|nr:hypothetical protein [Ptychographa xylographoides]
MEDPTPGSDPELEAQLILLAATNHNLEALQTLLRAGAANVQDPDTGYTPLHAAVAACEASRPPSLEVPEVIQTVTYLTNGRASNGDISEQQRVLRDGGASTRTDSHTRTEDDILNSVSHKEELLEAAEKTIRLLFQNGAIWNDLDLNNETPGCMANRLGLKCLYDIIVDAGVRAEMLLNRLDGYQILENEEDEDEEDEGMSEPVPDVNPTDTTPVAEVDIAKVPTNYPHEYTAHEGASPAVDEVTNEKYLDSNLVFIADRILDQESNGVMMAWETGIMQRTVDLIVPKTGLRILNIGHGMGIIDTFFQEKSPLVHHIVEAHPIIIDQMKKNGWEEKPGVTVHDGKWQDVVPRLIEEGTTFDAIYFDTFAEDYKALHAFFEGHLIGILDARGKWGFFNGLGADRQVCYDVYTKVVEMDLLEAGYDVEWETIPVPDLEQIGQWEGVKRPYWQLETYRLPVCTFIG